MKKALIWITIWLVIPAAVVTFGFYVIGPNLGRVPVIEQGALQVSNLGSGTPKAPEPAAPQLDPAEEEAAKPKSTVTIEGEVKRRRNQHRRATVEVVVPGRPKEDEAIPAGSDSPDPSTDEGTPTTDEPAPEPSTTGGDTAGA